MTVITCVSVTPVPLRVTVDISTSVVMTVSGDELAVIVSKTVVVASEEVVVLEVGDPPSTGTTEYLFPIRLSRMVPR